MADKMIEILVVLGPATAMWLDKLLLLCFFADFYRNFS
jgi:hypothetical protein